MVKTQVGIYTIVITVFVAGVFLLERVLKNDRKKQMCYCLMLVVYCGAVLWITMLSRQQQSERIAFLIPFESYPSAHQNYLDNVAAATKDGVVTALEKVRSFLYGYNWLILNVLLFIPYGILASMILPQTRKSKLFFYGILISVIIELIQYIFRLGCFDIDDLIQNTIGICVGFLLVNLLQCKQQTTHGGERRNG